MKLINYINFIYFFLVLLSFSYNFCFIFNDLQKYTQGESQPKEAMHPLLKLKQRASHPLLN